MRYFSFEKMFFNFTDSMVSIKNAVFWFSCKFNKIRTTAFTNHVVNCLSKYIYFIWRDISFPIILSYFLNFDLLIHLINNNNSGLFIFISFRIIVVG